MSYVDLKVTYSGVQMCLRDRCKAEAEDGSGFCGPCLAWLTERTNVDPLEAEPNART